MMWHVLFPVFSRTGKYEIEEESGEPSFYNTLMKLKIHNITESDFGLYQCLAKNSQGETSGEISIYGIRPCSILVYFLRLEVNSAQAFFFWFST